ncbi:hypothetical protein VNO80_23364 [Phaseolus coccineus]|uniref:Uncharacterized protein n=1 Tax=Phaseolus coccineus TaxID=3886 RepID=A0AAN9QV42_PHACN
MINSAYCLIDVCWNVILSIKFFLLKLRASLFDVAHHWLRFVYSCFVVWWACYIQNKCRLFSLKSVGALRYSNAGLIFLLCKLRCYNLNCGFEKYELFAEWCSTFGFLGNMGFLFFVKHIYRADLVSIGYDDLRAAANSLHQMIV